jgi:hypothetical protein
MVMHVIFGQGNAASASVNFADIALFAADTAAMAKRSLHLRTGTAATAVSRRTEQVMRLKPFPVGLVIPAQPVKASNRPPVPIGSTKSNMTATELSFGGTVPPCGSTAAMPMIGRRDCQPLPLLLRVSRPGVSRLTARRWCWPDGLSRFEELSRREGARTAILYAFDLIEHDGEDMRILPFLDRKAALARSLRNTKAGMQLERGRL